MAEAKRFKPDNTPDAAAASAWLENQQNDREIEQPNSFLCGRCTFPLHFEINILSQAGFQIHCSICHQECGTIQLTCDSCGLVLCCNYRSFNILLQGEASLPKVSCYNSYFDTTEVLREQVGGEKYKISNLSRNDQQRWLQGMWHALSNDSSKFRKKLLQASRVKRVSASNVDKVLKNLGLEIIKSLVRMAVKFYLKLDAGLLNWFLALINLKRESLGVVALEASVSLKSSLNRMKLMLLHLLEIKCTSSQLNKIFEIASNTGELETLEFLLDHHPNIDPSTNDNFAIKVASARGDMNVLERLLRDDRVDPSAQDSRAFQLASMHGHLNVVERLLQDGRIDPSAEQNLAIRAASIEGHLNMVERLLQDDRVNPSGHNNGAIQWASEYGCLNVVERLLQDDRVDPSANDNSAIRLASKRGHLNVVERLLQDDRVDPSGLDNDAIQMASEYGHLNVVKLLLQDARVDPSANDNNAICIACTNGRLHVVERLLQDDRVDPSANDNYPILCASATGHLNVVERLLQDDRVDPSSDYVLSHACSNGHLNVVKRLLQDDRVSIYYSRGISNALLNDHVDILTFLIQDGHIFPYDEYYNVLTWACESGNMDIVELCLKDDRVDPSVDYNAAILAATENGHANIVDRLLQDERVDPTAGHNHAIIVACDNGYVEVVERLLQDDRVNPSANSGEAMELAAERNHDEVLLLLLQDDRMATLTSDEACDPLQHSEDTRVLQCLYDRNKLVVCYMTDKTWGMQKLEPIYNESLVMGGLCLNHTRIDDQNKFLPRDIILMILSEWANLYAPCWDSD